MAINLNSASLDYRFARPLSGDNDEWERVLDADSPLDEDGSYAGPPDVFKLEFSGWCSHIEFKPKGEKG